MNGMAGCKILFKGSWNNRKFKRKSDEIEKKKSLVFLIEKLTHYSIHTLELETKNLVSNSGSYTMCSIFAVYYSVLKRIKFRVLYVSKISAGLYLRI